LSVDFDILTPERVSLQYEVAGIGSRGAALLVDTAIQLAVIGVVTLVWGLSGGLAPRTSVGAVLVGIWAVMLFLILFVYFPIFEIVWQGQTPGKRVLGLRVIRETGYPVRPVDAMIRNLVRLVDLLPGVYAVGVIAMLVNRRAKRLGDFAAGTLVVRERTALGQPRLWTAVDAPLRVALTREDATLVRDFLLRRASMDPEARRTLAARLASALATRYALPLDQSAELFLERLAG
jgi:uncharacterized RDD family membrane protein YckC